MEVKLYIGNLAAATTAEELRQLFAPAGTVLTAEVLTDAVSGQSKGYAFVTMSTQAEAQAAIHQFQAYALAGQPLLIRAVKPRPAASAAPNPYSNFFQANPTFKKGRVAKPAGGYQSQLSAFGKGHRRSGSERPRH